MKKTYLLAGLVVGILAVSAVSAAYAANAIGGNGNKASGKISTEIVGQVSGNSTGGCGMKNGTGRQGGCAMHNGTGNGVNFVDANNNGICDHAEELIK